MVDKLDPLIRFHRDEIEQLAKSDPRRESVHQCLVTLRFAQALQRKQSLSKSAALPAHVIAVGPTQSGKSTLVNLMLGLDQAGVSELAGYTVHCQGFAVDEFDHALLQPFFPDSELVEQSQLQRDVLSEYSCTYVGDVVSEASKAAVTGMVVWDTPDFDSVAQRSYRSPLFETLALADVVLMVVSKEKYADKSVWDVLKILAVSQKEVLLVVNKATQDVRDALQSSIQNKLDNLNRDLSSEFTPKIQFIDEVKNPLTDLGDTDDLIRLRKHVANIPTSADAEVQKKAMQDVVRYYWQDWTSSVTQQHDNQREWRTLVEQSCETLLANYEKEYLDSKRHDETLQLAVAELLVLLEIPGLAEPLTRIRNLVTWPVRKVLSSAAGFDGGTAKKDNRGEEQRLLESLFDHSLTELSSTLASRQSPANDEIWWQLLQTDLKDARDDLKKGWKNESDNHQLLLKVETERAARALYKKLEEQPATLNSLRAARVTADAAAVVLAVKSGGLGAADLVIAPAVLSLTTMLTESALGQYMKKVQQDLKRYQKKSVSSMVNRKLKIKLHSLASGSPAAVSSEKLSELSAHYQLQEGQVDEGQVVEDQG